MNVEQNFFFFVSFLFLFLLSNCQCDKSSVRMASPVVVFILALLWSCWWCDVAFVAADTTAATETFARVQNVMNDATWLLRTFEELEISVNRPRIDATSYEVYLSPLQRQQLQQRNIAFEELLHPAAVSEEVSAHSLLSISSSWIVFH
jgi:hypothetical protein